MQRTCNTVRKPSASPNSRLGIVGCDASTLRVGTTTSEHLAVVGVSEFRSMGGANAAKRGLDECVRRGACAEGGGAVAFPDVETMLSSSIHCAYFGHSRTLEQIDSRPRHELILEALQVRLQMRLLPFLPPRIHTHKDCTHTRHSFSPLRYTRTQAGIHVLYEPPLTPRAELTSELLESYESLPAPAPLLVGSHWHRYRHSLTFTRLRTQVLIDLDLTAPLTVEVSLARSSLDEFGIANALARMRGEQEIFVKFGFLFIATSSKRATVHRRPRPRTWARLLYVCRARRWSAQRDWTLGARRSHESAARCSRR